MTITVKLPGDQQVVLDKDHIVVGRGPDCDIRLSDDQGVQPRHAIINKLAGRWLIQSEGDWLLQVGGGVPGRKCWLKTNDIIHLTEAGPDIVFVQGSLPTPSHQQFSSGEPPVALVEPIVSPDARPVHLPDAGTEVADSTTASTFSPDTSRTLAASLQSSHRDDQPLQSPPPLPFPVSARPQQQPSAKSLVARMAIPACWAGLLVIAIGTIWFALEWNKTRQIRFAVEFGGELWGKGAKVQAVEQYRPILPILAPDDQAAVIYQRVIEVDLDKGNRESAKSLIHQALDRGVILAFDTREAAGLLAEVKSKSTVEEPDDEDTTTAGVARKTTDNRSSGKKHVKHVESKSPQGTNTNNQASIIRTLHVPSARVMDLTADLGIHWEQTGNDVTDGNETKQWTGKRLSDDSMVLALLGEYNGLLAIFQISLAGPGNGGTSHVFGTALARTSEEVTGWGGCRGWLATNMKQVLAGGGKREVVHEGIRVAVTKDKNGLHVLFACDAALKKADAATPQTHDTIAPSPTKSRDNQVTQGEYTSLTPPKIPAGRVHDWNPETEKMQSIQGKEDRKPPVVEDISKIDFSQGPDGEPIEVDIHKPSTGEGGMESYYYRDKSGNKVRHGLFTYQNPAGQRPGGEETVGERGESVYVYGDVKFRHSWDSRGKPSILEQYYGDNRHTRVEYDYYGNGELRWQRQYRVEHIITATEERQEKVPDGRHVEFFFSGIVNGQIGRISREMLYENGYEVGIDVYDQEGNLRMSKSGFRSKGEQH